MSIFKKILFATMLCLAITSSFAIVPQCTIHYLTLTDKDQVMELYIPHKYTENGKRALVNIGVIEPTDDRGVRYGFQVRNYTPSHDPAAFHEDTAHGLVNPSVEYQLFEDTTEQSIPPVWINLFIGPVWPPRPPKPVVLRVIVCKMAPNDMIK